MLDESTDITVDKNVCAIWKMVDKKPGSYQFYVDKWEGLYDCTQLDGKT